MKIANVIDISNMQIVPNYALSFDGVDDFTETIHNEILNFNGGDFTYEFKFKSSADNWQCIIAKNAKNYISAKRMRILINNSGNGKLFFECDDDITNSDSYGNTTVNDNVWHTASLVHTNGTGYELFVDGVSDATASDNGDIDNTEPFYIGAPTDKNYFDGLIDEVRIWNTARTQQEIQDNMNKELTGNETGLVAYYKMDKGTGSTLIDYAGTNDGKIIGATWQEVE